MLTAKRFWAGDWALCRHTWAAERDGARNERARSVWDATPGTGLRQFIMCGCVFIGALVRSCASVLEQCNGGVRMEAAGVGLCAAVLKGRTDRIRHQQLFSHPKSADGGSDSGCDPMAIWRAEMALMCVWLVFLWHLHVTVYLFCAEFC